jgi:hypothetical protein
MYDIFNPVEIQRKAKNGLCWSMAHILIWPYYWPYYWQDYEAK